MANLGAITLPVRMQVGDSEPFDIGEVAAEMAFDPATGGLTAPTINTLLAELLDATAATLRREVTVDADAPSR